MSSYYYETLSKSAAKTPYRNFAKRTDGLVNATVISHGYDAAAPVCRFVNIATHCCRSPIACSITPSTKVTTFDGRYGRMKNTYERESLRTRVAVLVEPAQTRL